ncbi:MAG TPA: two-component regulator propeller domain-containing protein [Bacteroidales bacterium]
MKTIIRNIFFIVLSWLFLPVSATNLEVIISGVDLPADLSAEQINHLLSDSHGLVWFGTVNGLYRWDGQRALFFSKNQKNEAVAALALSRDGKVWVAFADGSLAYVEGRQLTPFAVADSSFSTNISSMVFDEENRLWLGTEGDGIYCLDGEKLFHFAHKDGLKDEYIYDLKTIPGNKVAAATDFGIAICNFDKPTGKFSVETIVEGLPDVIVTALDFDGKNTLWLGFHKGGMGYYSLEEKKFHQLKLSNTFHFGQIIALETNAVGTWVADDKNGLMLVNGNERKNLDVIFFNGKAFDEKVKTILSDGLGNLFILTQKGMYVSSGGVLSMIKQAGDFSLTDLHAVAAPDLNHFWVANNNGLVEINGDEHKVFLDKVLEPTVRITALSQANDGRIWIATFGQGLICFDPSTEKHWFINEKNGLINDNVLSVNCKDNIIWAATLGGASKITLSENTVECSFQIASFDKQNGLGNNYIYTILQDSRGNVWFGTDGNGLVKYSNGSFQFFDENSGIGDDVVYAITEDENGEIWFSTSSSGLYSYDGNIFKNYSTSEGLSSQNILSIACKDQHVFILTDKGLDVFHKEGNIFINMFEDSENEKLQADLNSVYTGKNYVCFAVQSGLIIVKTNAFDNNTYEPVTLLDWVTVNLQALSDTNEQNFSSDENRFVFEYSGLWFPSPQKVRYKVKLDGYDPEWKTTYDHSVSYPNLPPGKYTFKVVSFLGMAVAQGKQASFSFEIKKPFYRQVWFIILVAAILVFLIYRFIIFRETRLKQIEARKKEKLEFEFQTLKNQVNPHFLFNSFSTLISIIEENPEKAVNYTEALSDFFRDILEVKDQELIPLKEEIRMIKNFNFIQQQRFGDQFLLKIELDERALNSVIPPLTLQLLTENAIKHNVVSKSKPLVVLIKNDMENIYVENNRNTKKTVEKSTGIGLQNIRDRYKLTSGKEIRVVENEKKYAVILPIINK